ncbi:hypothetical protein O3Q52_47825 [Streptomyces sp. ActVer]|uniref:hypothetical protein n=1 Tax=Streptomyces sp. ActVer TaxID=3014558 RepID=UPI0022B5137E|nr:hypothetical protein [Streptomyces sp. ActVer]MCZ4515693.1 hypothetical protein [Streptomyces sp. ActVer]
MADETVERLAKMRRAMGKMLRAGREKEFEALAGAYAKLKGEHVTRVHEEYVAQRRAVVAARGGRPTPAAVSEAERWRRMMRRRYGSGATSVIWRPGSRGSR